MNSKATLTKEIRKIGKVLADSFDVWQIILFGSHAYGQPHAESDLDICVILDLGGRRKIEWMREIRKSLAGVVTSPLDILVYEPKEFEARATVSSTLEHQISKQGIRLYEQQRHRIGVAQGS